AVLIAQDEHVYWLQIPRRGHKFAGSSTLHGISHIFNHGRCTAHNFLWTMAFLASLGFLFYANIDRVEFYFQYPHATTLEEETLQSLIFPAVTICNVNLLRFSEISGQDLYWAGEFLGFLDSSDKIVAPQNADAEVVRILRQKLQQSKGERNLPFDFGELYDRAGHQMDQMLIKCKFVNESCNVDDFKTVSRCLGSNGGGTLIHALVKESPTVDFPGTSNISCLSF
uniref:Uncharacterized protein n=1 Tax=Laticauda laticaudata TaxID=8630 RepID=A0A8C5S6T4_LATLA